MRGGSHGKFDFLIAILLAGASHASFTAKRTVVFTEGGNWATTFCSSAHDLCKYPLWLLMKFVSAIRI